MNPPADAPIPQREKLQRTWSRTSTSTWVDEAGKLRDNVSTWNYIADDPRFALTSWHSDSSNVLHSKVDFGMECGGPPNRVHGGCVGTVMDSVMAHFAWNLYHRPAFTLDLRVNYKGATPLGSTCWSSVWLISQSGRRCVVGAKLEADGKVVVTAEATFVASRTTTPEEQLKQQAEHDQEILKQAMALTIPSEYPERPSLEGVPGLDWPEDDPEYRGITAVEDLELVAESGISLTPKPPGQASWDCHANGRAKVPCRYFINKERQQWVGAFWFSPLAQGPPGIAHGGAIYTAFDCFMGLGTRHLGTWSCVTKWLKVTYLKHCPIGSIGRFEVVEFSRSKDGRENYVKSALIQNGVRLAEAEAVFIRTLAHDLPHDEAMALFGPNVSRAEAAKNYARVFGGSALALTAKL